MNSKKKADLQRKLTLAQVPKPPADLLDRIKRDIPPHLVMAATSDRDRFTRSIFFDMRVAASVLLIITSAFFALQVLSHADQKKLAELGNAVPHRAPVAPLTLTAETARTTEPVQVARLDRPAVAETAPAAVPAVRQRSQGRRDAAPSIFAFDAVQGTTAMPTVVAEAPVAAAPPPPLADASRKELAALGYIGPSAQPAAPAPAPVLLDLPAASANVAGGIGLIAEANAADLRLAKKKDVVFGISTDDRAFERIKTAIEQGKQPESENIDVAALVNYFAGSAKHESHDVRLEAEGSPAPVMSEPGRRMIRVTVDTETADLAPGASLPPIATNAKIDVQFDNSAVVAYHLVGADEFQIEPTLLKNTSVTALYDVIMAPHGTSWQRVGSFRVTYTSVTDGREHKLEKMLRRRDLEKTWIAASRRHRLASLGAIWGETLKGMAGANDVARRAEELASQEPQDARARELADVAAATSQLHGTASGSSR